VVIKPEDIKTYRRFKEKYSSPFTSTNMLVLLHKDISIYKDI